MAKPTLGDIIAAVPDPMLSDNFVLDIPNLPIAVSPLPLLMQCRTATKPGMTINAVEVQLFGHTVEHAGNLTYNHDMNVEYLENRKAEIQTILEGWAEYVRQHDTQHGAYKSEYARDGYLRIFDQRGVKVKEYRIVNMWPSVVPEVQFDGQASNIIALSATFKFDYYQDRSSGR